MACGGCAAARAAALKALGALGAGDQARFETALGELGAAGAALDGKAVKQAAVRATAATLARMGARLKAGR